MEIVRFQSFQFFDMLHCTDLNFLLSFPKVVIFCQILCINSHLNDFTIMLQLSKDVDVNKPSVVYKLEVFGLDIIFPISQQDLIFEDVLRRDFVIGLHNWSPVCFWECIVSKIYNSSRELMRSPIFFFWPFLFGEGQIFQSCISRRLQIVLLLLAHNILMAFTTTLLTETSQHRSFVFFSLLQGPRHSSKSALLLKQRRKFDCGFVIIFSVSGFIPEYMCLILRRVCFCHCSVQLWIEVARMSASLLC